MPATPLTPSRVAASLLAAPALALTVFAGPALAADTVAATAQGDSAGSGARAPALFLAGLAAAGGGVALARRQP